MVVILVAWMGCMVELLKLHNRKRRVREIISCVYFDADLYPSHMFVYQVFFHVVDHICRPFKSVSNVPILLVL